MYHETLTTIRTALARLPALRAFRYTYASFRPITAHLEHDRATVASWAAGCPALRQCTLNGLTWKRRAATGEWLCKEALSKEPLNVAQLMDSTPSSTAIYLLDTISGFGGTKESSGVGGENNNVLGKS
ncbi:hypothetical protein C8J57DRAFT_1477044 [Mycena rebaudengoi]|nr:hypothetical protein C8J57DRAFT_1477044 [Mycena rebaudengoi]